ncbi:MAG: aminotransferase class I/II-fold pyridoxal phosphate-dependent enzyme, partial [Myxococcales bacterium]|nr:aminotransferase class I/II-fold pyridoxal phosphate-dependent enzyme [Myxococcales bacterium]
MMKAVERVLGHVAALPQQRASNDGDATATLAALREPIPEQGTPYDQLLDLLFGPLAQMGLNCGSAGALSYIQGGGLIHSVVADLITGGINPYVAYSGPGPGFAQLEQTVIRWFADLIGLPAEAGGVLLSGGSLANFSAIVTARCAHLGEDFRDAVLYASDQVHHSIPKGAMLAGLPSGSVALVASNARGEIDLTALTERIARDRDSGRRPFLIVASAGTTNTGAVDDLHALADIAADQKLWLHVDGAYGGLFAFTARGRERLRGIERADSVVLNPHKTLFLPYGTGCLLVREAEALRRAHLLHADYIHAAVERSEALGSAVNFADLAPELSRDHRGLRIWLPM